MNLATGGILGLLTVGIRAFTGSTYTDELRLEPLKEAWKDYELYHTVVHDDYPYTIRREYSSARIFTDNLRRRFLSKCKVQLQASSEDFLPLVNSLFVAIYDDISWFQWLLTDLQSSPLSRIPGMPVR